tara:strand:+ start:106205 stop:106768 length:564 start_codon:yes stop_codon:yes gene_type:complete
MKICKGCKQEFKTHIKIDGKWKSATSRRYCFDCSPYGLFNRTWTDEQLKINVKGSRCYTELLTKLGLSARGNNWTSIKKHIKRLKLDIDHFAGDIVAIEALNRDNKKSDGQVFCENSKVAQITLRRRFKKKQRSSHCSTCQCDDVHNGKPLILQIDHINGKNNDNRLENLRWLCPNCHSQTKTFSRK